MRVPPSREHRSFRVVSLVGMALGVACGAETRVAAPEREVSAAPEVRELTEAEQLAAAREMVEAANARVRVPPTPLVRLGERLDEVTSEAAHFERLSHEAGREVPPRLRAHLARDLLRDARALLEEDASAAPALTRMIAARLCAAGASEAARTLRLVYDALEPRVPEPCSSPSEGREIP